MFTDPKTGEPMTFPEIVVALLVEERGRSKEDAEKLVESYPEVIVSGMMSGMQYRATAIALEMRESEVDV